MPPIEIWNWFGLGCLVGGVFTGLLRVHDRRRHERDVAAMRAVIHEQGRRLLMADLAPPPRVVRFNRVTRYLADDADLADEIRRAFDQE